MPRLINDYEKSIDYDFKNILYQEYQYHAAERINQNDRLGHIMPVQETNRIKMQTKMDMVRDIVHATTSKLTKKLVIDEIQGRVYRRLNPVIVKMESCLKQQFDLHDQNTCVRNFEATFDQNVIPFVINVIKEY